jgi:hypothetical protein
MNSNSLRSSSKRYHLVNTTLGVLFSALAGGMAYASDLKDPIWIYILLAGFPALLHFASFQLAVKAESKSPIGFTNAFMGGVVLKMLASITLIFLLLLVFKPNKSLLVVTYFVPFFSHLGFEVYHLLSNLRTELKSPKDPQ